MTEEEKQGQIRPKKEYSMEQIPSKKPLKPMPAALKEKLAALPPESREKVLKVAARLAARISAKKKYSATNDDTGQSTV